MNHLRRIERTGLFPDAFCADHCQWRSEFSPTTYPCRVRPLKAIVATFLSLGIHEDTELRETAILAASASGQVQG